MAGRAEKEQELLAKFNIMRQEQQSIANKISDLEIQRSEHELVVKTLKTVPGDRKCYRMVGEVLTERTVVEVLPAVETNCAGIKKVMDTLQQQIVDKGKEINTFKTKHNIQTKEEASRLEKAQQASRQSK
ncbi:hypothetical protein SARC_03382 [Sphaeroforma arctica JP610]|uniref:Prefoldin subunit 2 n=1 Tax=Sphaeroforma arctica JP610 TaxID=667725 RepID=A0A0L0G612_9EUKA|nr:hypothetical protein SARC_03382 [Sphaeroforma arctica JP610]KNC84389.1 hypothetical protein SARC_03382 [Sphaeroforma arctica JP610]|eukprot:XP_014158291.1 hypothetical protein SARC_03382 [Sphaeroforma arctica JP610]